MAELTGYQRQCDVQVSRGVYCTLVLGHSTQHDGRSLLAVIEECYFCWAAPRYLLDGRLQQHAEQHRANAAAEPEVVTERLGAPDAR